MYVCICKGITDKQLEEAKMTSNSIKDICKKLGLGSECGTCIKEVIVNSITKKEEGNQNKDMATQTT